MPNPQRFKRSCVVPQAAGNCLLGEATCPDNIILEGTLGDWPEMFQKVAAAGDSKNTSI